MTLASLMLIPGSRSASAAPPEVGVWVDHDGKGAIEIKACGQALCGNIVWLKNPLNDQGEPLFDRRNPDTTKRDRPICGLPVIGNLKLTSDGWDDGWIYSPEEGSQYDLALKATTRDKLTVTGYKGVKLFSKTFVWTRAPASLEKCGNAASQTKLPVPPAPKAATPKPDAGTAAATKKPAAVPAIPKSADRSAPVKKAATASDSKPANAGPKPANAGPTTATKPAAAKPAAKPGAPATGPAAAKAAVKPAATKKADPAKGESAKSAKATSPTAPVPAKAAKPAESSKKSDPKAAKSIADKKAAAKKKSAEDAAAPSAVE